MKQEKFTVRQWNLLDDMTKTTVVNFCLCHYRRGCRIPDGWPDRTRFICQEIDKGVDVNKYKPSF